MWPKGVAVLKGKVKHVNANCCMQMAIWGLSDSGMLCRKEQDHSITWRGKTSALNA